MSTEIPPNADTDQTLFKYVTQTHDVIFRQHPQGIRIEMTTGFSDSFYLLKTPEIEHLKSVLHLSPEEDLMTKIAELVNIDKGQDLQGLIRENFKPEFTWISDW